MASLVLKSAGFGGRVIELNLGANRLGRGAENEIQIEHSTISTRHCEFVLAHDGVTVRDCASAQGTFVDGRRTKAARLSPGQILRLGKVELLVESTGVTVAIPKFTAPQAGALAAPSDRDVFCVRHPEAYATHRCTCCRKALCTACVRRVRRRGGRMATVCPHCGGFCELVCSRHCGARATRQCIRCRKVFCEACVRHVRRAGGRVWKFCRRCTRECVLICPRHPEVRAIFRCTRCGVAVCGACARFAQRLGGPPVRVCPICRHPCQLMCASHPEARATHRCTKCRELLCPDCVQTLRGRGGQILTFCCRCSEPCVPVKDRQPKKKSLLDRLQATVKTALRRKPRRARPSRSAKPGNRPA